ncbi:hypothetical protein Hdeb2414_s0019g00547861 [Helianthus debilis subsp. tardiflorus]
MGGCKSGSCNGIVGWNRLVGYSELWSLLNRLAVAELMHTSTEVSEIVFFLLGAMTIIEIVDAHQGFKLVTNNITTRKPHTLIWV